MKKIFIALIFALIAFSASYSLETTVEYDGVWFLGFNLHKDVFSSKNTRKAFKYLIDKNYIAKTVIGDENIPLNILPETLIGGSTKEGVYVDIKKASSLLKLAGYSKGDKRLKGLVLVHTDGIKTVEIANKIKKDLSKGGIEITLKKIPYIDSKEWTKTLEGGRNHLFLMGYKANDFDTIYIGDKTQKIFHMLGCEKVPDPKEIEIFSSYDDAQKNKYSPCEICKPSRKNKDEAEDILKALFYSKGEANFTFFANSRVDSLLDQLSQTDKALSSERKKKISEIAEIINEEVPVVPLFYIKKL